MPINKVLKARIELNRGNEADLSAVLSPLLGEPFVALDTNKLFIYNGTSWFEISGSGGASALSGLTDVTLTSPAAGEFLKYSGTTWLNSGIALSDVSGLVTNLSALQDNIDAEAATRQSVDDSLQTQIDDKANTADLAAVAFSGAYADLSGKPQLAQTKNAVTSEWLRSYDASTGLFTSSQPSFADLSGSATSAQIPTALLDDILQKTYSSGTSFTINSTEARKTTWQFNYSSASADYQVNIPIETVMGYRRVINNSGKMLTLDNNDSNLQIAPNQTVGIFITDSFVINQLDGGDPVSFFAVGSKWLNSYNSFTGEFTATQPDYSDLTGTPTLPANTTATADRFFTAYDSSTGAFTKGQVAYSGISGTPQLAQTKTAVTSQWLRSYDSTTGLFTASQPAYSDISGTPQLAQTKAAVTSNWLRSYDATTGLFTASQPAASDITGLAAIATSGKWSDLQDPSAALTLSMAGNASTFNHTSGVVWTFANTTTSSSGTNSSSPVMRLAGKIFASGVDTTTNVSLQNIVANGITGAVTNGSETAGNVVTLTITGHSFATGMIVTLTNLTTFTWLNNLNVRITSVTANTILFTDPTAHGAQSSTAITGTATQVPRQELTLTPSGTPGDTGLVLPDPGVATMPVIRFSTAGADNVGIAAQTPGGQSALGGISMLLGSNASANAISFYTATATAIQTIRGAIAVGDTSTGNSRLTFRALAANFAVEVLGNISSEAVKPAVMLANGTTFTATSGNQIGVGCGYSTNVSTSLNFAPTSGTATFQSLVTKYTVNQTGGANGAVTGFLVNAVETAVGGTHLLMDLQAGTTGGTSQFAVNNVGKITKYNAISTVLNGVAAEYASVGLTAQGANVAATTLYAVPSTGAGLYRVSVYIVVSRAGTTSTMPDTRITYTDRDSSGVITINATASSNGNSTTTFAQATFVINAKASTNIQYDIGQVNAYASTGGTSMQFAYRAVVEAL